MTKMPTELQDVIIKGLQNLMALRLRGAPAADTLEATAKAWILALTAKPVAWDAERDVARMKKAFVTLMGNCETWPTPVAFYERLPPREQQKSITHQSENTMSPKTRALIDGMMQKMRSNPRRV